MITGPAIAEPLEPAPYTVFSGGSNAPEDLLFWTGAVADLLKELIAEAPGEINLSRNAKDGLFCLLQGIANTINQASQAGN